MISRNHSNVSKPAFVISQVLYYSSRNQLTFLFYCLLWNKTRKKASHLFIPSITQQTQPFPGEFVESPSARFRPLSILPRKTQKKTRRHDRRKFIPSGWDWMGWYMDLVTNHSKPTSIGQKHSHCLANYSNSVVIGYSGRKLPWKLLTIVYKGKPLPRNPFVCSCWVRLEFIVNLLQRKTRFWFITVVRGDPVCWKKDCSQYDIGLVFKETSSYSDQDKLKFIENVWKSGELFDFPVSASGMFEF